MPEAVKWESNLTWGAKITGSVPAKFNSFGFKAPIVLFELATNVILEAPTLIPAPVIVPLALTLPAVNILPLALMFPEAVTLAWKWGAAKLKL